jgi:hypothetical protein
MRLRSGRGRRGPRSQAPRKLLQEGRGNEFRNRLSDHLALFARAFARD